MMGSLPKPLIGLLLGTVAFFALWMVALKPSSSSSSSGSQGGVGQYQSAINQAHQAATTAGKANAKLGAPTATTAAKPKTTTAAKPTTTTAAKPTTTPAVKPATKTTATKPSTKTTAAKAANKPAPVSIAAQVQTVENAVRGHKVVAVLFYNPAAADDQSMVNELGAIATSHGALVKLSVPVTELTQFAVITTKVPVVTSPTLVIVDAKGQASTLTGFAGSGEIRQRIDDALAAK